MTSVQATAKHSKKAVLIIDFAEGKFKRLSDNLPVQIGSKDSTKDVVRLILEARRLAIPVFGFMEENCPLVKPICNAMGNMPIFEKFGFDAFGQLKGNKRSLQDLLARLGVTELFIAGYLLEVCVGKTMTSAITKGYTVHTSSSVLFTSMHTPDDGFRGMLSYYMAEGILEPDFNSLLARLRQ